MKILIKHFSSMNNYGSAMMGLITIQKIYESFSSQSIEIFIDSKNKFMNLDELDSELPTKIPIRYFNNEDKENITKIKNSIVKKFAILRNIFCPNSYKIFNKVIVLGGDDFSEFYSKRNAGIEIIRYNKIAKNSEVILLGQTIGPFKNKFNRLCFKYFLPTVKVYARDQWTVNYLLKEFKIKVEKIYDIAFLDLPLQYNKKIEEEVLNQYCLEKDNYATFVISGLIDEGYYCKNRTIYLQSHKIIIEKLLSEYNLKKIVLLAHTFPPYGDESVLIRELNNICNDQTKERLILITEKILPTKARFILGNGLFTITGRMHPAISTFQMGKPAITFAYSPKYYGVIGESINRYDLIIDAALSENWEKGNVVDEALKKIAYLLNNYNQIKKEIMNSVDMIKAENIKKLGEILK